jgi:hypothetical protein
VPGVPGATPVPGGLPLSTIGDGKAWPFRSVWLQCVACAHQTSVTAGTIFQDTRTPLPTWFGATGWVTNQKTGVSALGLQRALGLRSSRPPGRGSTSCGAPWCARAAIV